MNNVLCLGDFSSGKSSFINMLLGVRILPEQLQSTNLPIIKIFNGDTAGIYLRERGEKNPKHLSDWSNIPQDWSSFEYVELTVPNHPLLKKGLVLWDSPGINSTHEHHTQHTEASIKEHELEYDSVLYFISGPIQETHLAFIEKWASLQSRLRIVINIKTVMEEKACRKIESQVQLEVGNRIGAIPVHLLYIGDAYEDFAAEADKKTAGLEQQEIMAGWKRLTIDFDALKEKHENTIIGDVVLDILANKPGKKKENLNLLKPKKEIAETEQSLQSPQNTTNKIETDEINNGFIYIVFKYFHYILLLIFLATTTFNYLNIKYSIYYYWIYWADLRKSSLLLSLFLFIKYIYRGMVKGFDNNNNPYSVLVISIIFMLIHLVMIFI